MTLRPMKEKGRKRDWAMPQNPAKKQNAADLAGAAKTGVRRRHFRVNLANRGKLFGTRRRMLRRGRRCRSRLPGGTFSYIRRPIVKFHSPRSPQVTMADSIGNPDPSNLCLQYLEL